MASVLAAVMIWLAVIVYTCAVWYGGYIAGRVDALREARDISRHNSFEDE